MTATHHSNNLRNPGKGSKIVSVHSTWTGGGKPPLQFCCALEYQDSEILGFWSEIDDMVLALLRATMTSGGCARQFWHGQGCPEVIRYRELEKSWRLSERKPLDWSDFRVGRDYSRDYSYWSDEVRFDPPLRNRPSAGITKLWRK